MPVWTGTICSRRRLGDCYHKNEVSETPVVFDLFYRKNPDNGGYVIATGLEQVIEYINNLHFDQEDLDYMKEKGFNDKFIDYCRNFKFTGTLHAVKEGTVVYPYEPIIQVVAPMNQAQLVETALLLTINHQSLIATKASRIKRTAGDALVMEFGARRAHSYDGAIIGASDFEPLKNLTKSEVRILAMYLGVPEEIINKAPSADLWQGQTDEDEMGMTYEEMDKAIRHPEEANPEILAKVEEMKRKSRHKMVLFA